MLRYTILKGDLPYTCMHITIVLVILINVIDLINCMCTVKYASNSFRKMHAFKFLYTIQVSIETRVLTSYVWIQCRSPIIKQFTINLKGIYCHHHSADGVSIFDSVTFIYDKTGKKPKTEVFPKHNNQSIVNKSSSCFVQLVGPFTFTKLPRIRY